MVGIAGSSGKKERHDEIITKIKEYVSNPKNFEMGSKSISEIARDLGLYACVVSYNLKLMYYRPDGGLPKNLVIIEKPKMMSVFLKPNTVESTG